MKKFALLIAFAAGLNAQTPQSCEVHNQMAHNAYMSEIEWKSIGEVGIGAGAKDAWFMASKAHKVYVYHKNNYNRCVRGEF